MINNRKIGATGLSIPDINTSITPQPKKSTQDIAKWCATLPMADVGAAAKKLFVQLKEISATIMSAQERFPIMELLRSPNKIICTALKIHYIEQKAPLTEHKLIIANLRQTLITAMADNYKLILEDLHKKTSLSVEEKKLMATTIVRIYYYLNVLLICRYQLYTYAKENVWSEIYLLYKYAKQRNLLEVKVPCQFATKNNETTILEAYMHIILLYATDPYQWRQREQHSLNKAIEMWALYPTIYVENQIPNNKHGVYIIDLDKDAPPQPYNFNNDIIGPSCIAVDLDKSVQHLKKILGKMQDDHLKAKIDNPNDPEFSVTAPTIAKLIKIWSQAIVRVLTRFPVKTPIKIVFGLNAAYYYINGEKEFNPHPKNLHTHFEKDDIRPISKSFKLPLYEVLEEDDDQLNPPILSSQELITETTTTPTADDLEDPPATKEELYHIYHYNIANISTHGFCIVIEDKSYPPFQSGEIIAVKNEDSPDANWGIGTVRWMRRQKNENFQIGIQIIASFGQSAGIQLLREDKPAGRLLRCIILPADKNSNTSPMLLTSALPLHSQTVILYIDNSDPIKAVLTREVDASGMYYQYEYTTNTDMKIISTKQKETSQEHNNKNNQGEEKTNTEFDSIWGDL